MQHFTVTVQEGGDNTRVIVLIVPAENSESAFHRAVDWLDADGWNIAWDLTEVEMRIFTWNADDVTFVSAS